MQCLLVVFMWMGLILGNDGLLELTDAQKEAGWKPLCAFLGVPVPEEPYPHVNEAKVIKRFIVVLKGLRWLPHALLVAIAASLAL